jgi:IMP dehydrogenase
MSTVTEVDMMVAMANHGGLGILHRFLPIDVQRKRVKQALQKSVVDVAVSLGVGSEALSDAMALAHEGATIFCVDVAHGDSTKVTQLLSILKKELPHATLIGGNVATEGGALRLAEAGADVVKIGIGPGSVCTTRAVAGCGVPQLTAVAACSRALKQRGFETSVIADGGIKTSGDIVKAIAVGADAVMVGRLLAGTDEAPQGGRYFGMASTAAGRIRPGIAPEGVITEVPCQGPVADILENLRNGIQTGMSYQDALTLQDLREDPLFVKITSAGLYESGTRVN